MKLCLNCCAVIVVVIALAIQVPRMLQEREDAFLLQYPRPPIPNYGGIMTLKHDEEIMEKIAKESGIPKEKYASQFDLYYEAQLDNCDPDKNFVFICGTNSATHVYSRVIEHMRSKGYCTLIWDHRGHGRSEDAPGEFTAELLAEDAAAIIKHFFKGKKVNIAGHSLGAAITLYLGFEYPALVKTLTVVGMASCFYRVTEDGECDMSFDLIKWFFSRDYILKLMGGELQGKAAVSAIKMHDNERNMNYWRTLRTSTAIKTPSTWLRWNKKKYHEAIKRIEAPTLHVAGEYEDTIGFDQRTLNEDAKRIKKAETPVIIPGVSHFLFFETNAKTGESGHDSVMAAIDKFLSKNP